MCGLTLLLFVMMVSCANENRKETIRSHKEYGGRDALLLTKFHSLDQLKEVVDIEYLDFKGVPSEKNPNRVRIQHQSAGRAIHKVLKPGVSQKDFAHARDNGFWAKLGLLFTSPYSVWKRKDLKRVYALPRRRGYIFGVGDAAFFDLAETMMYQIVSEDTIGMPPEDYSEKGYLNTFNHVTAQAMVTTIFSERLASPVADAHERATMPALMTGKFTPNQLHDVKKGACDNYVDMVNNEWGQELGKQLKEKYNISRATTWTPVLLSSYLNDVQRYFSQSFRIGFRPFKESDELMVRFSDKINLVMTDLPEVDR